MTYTYQKIALRDDSAKRIGYATNQILRKEDNAVIPFDPENTDYQEYLAWVADGNTPDDEPEDSGES